MAAVQLYNGRRYVVLDEADTLFDASFSALTLDILASCKAGAPPPPCCLSAGSASSCRPRHATPTAEARSWCWWRRRCPRCVMLCPMHACTGTGAGADEPGGAAGGCAGHGQQHASAPPARLALGALCAARGARCQARCAAVPPISITPAVPHISITPASRAAPPAEGERGAQDHRVLQHGACAAVRGRC